MLQEIQRWIVTGILVGAFIAFAFLVFLITRYRRFKPNQFVIHLRNGKIFHSGLGGSIWLLPLIDEYVVIPATKCQTQLETQIQNLWKELPNIAIFSTLIWVVVDPEKAFASFAWKQNNINYVEKILNEFTEKIIRNTIQGLSIEKIFQERAKIISIIEKELSDKTKETGIEIESFEIRDVKKL